MLHSTNSFGKIQKQKNKKVRRLKDREIKTLDIPCDNQKVGKVRRDMYKENKKKYKYKV